MQSTLQSLRAAAAEKRLAQRNSLQQMRPKNIPQSSPPASAACSDIDDLDALSIASRNSQVSASRISRVSSQASHKSRKSYLDEIATAKSEISAFTADSKYTDASVDKSVQSAISGNVGKQGKSDKHAKMQKFPNSDKKNSKI